MYPGYKRYESDNFNPLPMWMAGIQSVALNFQTACLNMAAYETMFRQNGMTGFDKSDSPIGNSVPHRFRLKPAYMRSYSALRWFIEQPRLRPVYVIPSIVPRF